MQRIYLAGFDVFKADSVAYGASLKSLCRRYGYEGLYPLDNLTPAELGGRALADWIYRANIELIQQSDLVMANLNAFRGHEPDSGTAFEVGYAVALAKPVWAYTGQYQTLVERIAVTTGHGDARRAVDAEGYTVEDFGLNLNLMLACSATIVVGDAEACLARIQAHHAGQTPDRSPVPIEGKG